jgi:hypothetical protein
MVNVDNILPIDHQHMAQLFTDGNNNCENGFEYPPPP